MPANPDTSPSYETYYQQWDVIYQNALNSWIDHVDGLDESALELFAQQANDAIHIQGMGIDGVAWNSPASAKATEFILDLINRSEVGLTGRQEDIKVLSDNNADNLYP